MKKILFFLIIFFLGINIGFCTEDLIPNAKSGILIEFSTGKVLYEKNSHEKLPPASMTKVMSMLLFMEAIDSGRLSLNDDVLISEDASKMGGSQVYLSAGETYKVEELLKGIAVASGNDAVVALAEKLSGSVSSFVDKMNEKAKGLGMKDTVYKNPHGLDEKEHYTTAYDMALVAKELLKHEKILDYTSIYEYYMKKNDGSSTWLVNTNKLIRFYEGVDGLKTGFTEQAKYCLTATAKKNNMRLISVIMGEESSEQRSSDTVKLLNYGFNGYKITKLFNKGKIIQRVPIKFGVKEYVDVVLKDNVNNLEKNDADTKKLKYNVKINDLIAPLKKDDVVGYLEIVDENKNVLSSTPLTISEEIKKANFWDYFVNNFKVSLMGRITN